MEKEFRVVWVLWMGLAPFVSLRGEESPMVVLGVTESCQFGEPRGFIFECWGLEAPKGTVAAQALEAWLIREA